MDFIKALTLALGEVEEPVITRYRLGVVVQQLHESGVFSGEKATPAVGDGATASGFNRWLGKLEETGVLKELPGFGPQVFTLLGRKAVDAEEVACSVDPFCYVSHLSAMAHHGVTNRIPARLFLSSPAPAAWKAAAEQRMSRDLKEGLAAYRAGGLPQLVRLKLEKIGRREVHRFASSHLGAYTSVQGRVLRVSSLGRTFLDMLRNPELCGGMRHVMEVFEEYASVYSKLIINEVDLNGKPVEKVRAGYLLQEVLGLSDAVVEGWVKFAQRGGSRRLDAAGAYVPKWSEKWCLSLNL